MREPALTHPSATVYLGDCLDVLTEIPDNSVDAIVTDPPYGLGFMGKAWDDLPPGLPWAEECLRVLKPGGHLLAFGGTRTWHRLAVAVEDAGFEVRDSIAWLYGCHDDQTEVLTRRGWVNGLDLTEDDDVAQWATDGTVALVRPSARQRYPFDGRMVRFRNADVDQLVTPNHRVYRQVSERTMTNGERVARWSDWQVDQAADVNRWQRMRLPAAGIHDGPGIGGTDYAALLGWVWADGGFDLSGSGVRVYQSSTNQPYVDEIAALLDRVGPHKRYDYARTWKGAPYTMTTWYMSGDLARQIRADLPGKAPTWDLLWKMTADEKRALWDAAMKGDGSKSARTFWQKDRASLEWVQALLAGIGYRGKIADDPRGALHWSDRPTVELQARHLADDGEDYTGEVWCVTVPSGAFIVRRNGRVSVSGNSGFPKSLDVSKAIDKIGGQHPNWNPEAYDAAVVASGYTHADVDRHLGIKASSCYWARTDHRACVPLYAHWVRARDFLGLDDTFAAVRDAAEREVVAKGYRVDRHEGHVNYGSGTPDGVYDITAPATSNAEKWQGWGTALKPAFEPIVVARKPLIGTVAANVLAHGTGALNIAASRVGTDPIVVRGGGAAYDAEGNKTFLPSAPVNEERVGRYPANVLLDGSQAEALDAENVPSTSRVGNPRGAAAGDGWGMTATGAEYSDTGGPSRFFPTFRYQAKAPTRERPSYFRPTCDCENAWPTPTTSPARDTSETTAPASSSTSRSGSGSTADPSPTGTTSTISTTTSSTTTPATSSPSPRPTTSASTPDANSATEPGGSPAGSVESSSPSALPTGTSAEKDGLSTDGAAPATSPGWSQTDVCGVCGAATRRESHATVKPLALMRWLVRLVTPPGGTVLDTFTGSGATVEAAILEGFHVIGIEREADYLPLIQVRLDRVEAPSADTDA